MVRCSPWWAPSFRSVQLAGSESDPFDLDLDVMICSALIGATTACAIGGFAILWGAAVLLLMFIVGVTSPAFLRACDRWLNGPQTHRPLSWMTGVGST